MTTALSSRWQAFWFDSGSRRNLALTRIVTAATALWILLSRDLPGISGVPTVFWAAVPKAERWRFLLFPGTESLERVLEVVATLALIAVVLGVFPRVCAFVAGLLMYHLTPLEGIVWTANPVLRGCTVEILALFILAASPCGAAWAIRTKSRSRPNFSWEYSWPVQLIRTLIALIYFFSGWSKLVRSGVSWAGADNMRNWIMTITENDQINVFTAAGHLLLAHPALLALMGAGTLTLELTFPLVLFSRRFAAIAIPLVVLMHLAAVFTLNITVLYLPLFVVFVDAESARAGFARIFRPIRTPEKAAAGYPVS